jgi:hypothetical protein
VVGWAGIGVQEKYRGTRVQEYCSRIGVVNVYRYVGVLQCTGVATQWYRGCRGLHGIKSCAGYSVAGVVQCYRGTGIVQLYRIQV